jgi:hypothetical protein
VAFQPELALEDWRELSIHCRKRPSDPQPARLISAVGAQPGPLVGHELVELATGKALPRPADP